MIIKKCPYCDNNIRLHPVKFPVINDNGGIVIECENCNKHSFYETMNPAEISISKGGRKIDIWDNDGISKESFISKYNNIKELTEGILVIGDLEVRKYEFNFNFPHIYHCSDCGLEIESVAKNALICETQNIVRQYNSLMSYILANHRAQCDNLVVEINAECKCGKLFTSYWHKKFIPDNKKIKPKKDLYLIGTDLPINTSLIDGIISKKDCKRILEKFIIRWNAIYPKLLIVTPFIGHQWLSQEQIIELWDWIKNFLDQEKTSLVTRSATFNKYKKACEEKGISIELLEKYGLNNSILQDFTKKQDFHAKIYLGYSSQNTEMLLGSFNLMDGPSVENISFKSTNYDTLNDKFITPMKIKLDKPQIIESNWLRIFKNENGEWINFEISSEKILKIIMTYK